MVFCTRATRGLRRPSPGLMARPGKSIAKQSEGRAGEKYLPVGGRVRKLRAVGGHSAPIPEEVTSELGGIMRGQVRWSPVLVQRAVSEDPRWTRAVGDRSSLPSRGRVSGIRDCEPFVCLCRYGQPSLETGCAIKCVIARLDPRCCFHCRIGS